VQLLFVCKRHPQQRDLVERPYGRFYHLPTQLRKLGHAVRIQLCSYRKLPSVSIERDNVVWSSHDFLTLGPSKLWECLQSEAIEFRPDWVIGCSDAWAGWLASRLTRRLRCRLAIDAYDNFESYMPANLPLHFLWRRALKAADFVTAAGPQLATLLTRSRRSGSSAAHVIPMTADPAFEPLDRTTCRDLLKLPRDVPLFGYSGGWTKSRGSNLILDAFDLIQKKLPKARLVLTGKPPSEAITRQGVINLGYLPDELMPNVINAVDLSCVVVANTSFGRFSYPAKLCESIACNVPVVASATEPVTWMLHDEARFLARVGDANDYAQRMLTNYSMSSAAYPIQPTWTELAGRYEKLLND
jgi:glycosyltransferase involved in cell wall biosynthesis